MPLKIQVSEYGSQTIKFQAKDIAFQAKDNTFQSKDNTFQSKRFKLYTNVVEFQFMTPEL